MTQPNTPKKMREYLMVVNEETAQKLNALIGGLNLVEIGGVKVTATDGSEYISIVVIPPAPPPAPELPAAICDPDNADTVVT